jgi:hypothetical protein
VLARRRASIYHTGIYQGVFVMKWIYAAAALAAFAVSPVFAACTEPTPPQSLPDGNTATLQQMLAGKKAVNEYNTATNTYLDCLKSEHQAALEADSANGAKVSDTEKAKLDRIETEKHNAAVDRLQKVADQFNGQIRVYKQKSTKG